MPTAVPPSASSFSSGRASSSIFFVLLQRSAPAADLLGELQGRRVLQVGTAGLDDAPRSPPSSRCSWWPPAGQWPQAASSIAITAGDVHRRGEGIVEDWDMLMSSLGWSSFFLAISLLPRLAMTSLAFMLLWVPEPVCHTTSGKCPFRLPPMTSSQA